MAKTTSKLGNFLIIDDDTPHDVIFPKNRSRGYIPRDFSAHPAGMFASPDQMPSISRSEWDARITEQDNQESSLMHIRLRGNSGQPIPSLDQDGVGYCWAHSVTQTVVLSRALANQPYIPLSAFSVAATIKRGRDEGSWCGESAEFIRSRGVASQKVWPQGDRSYQKYDTAEVKADMAKHIITEDWVDVAKPIYDQNLTFDQVASCLLTNIPCAVDFNWWSHSVCAIRVVKIEAGSYGLLIWNSWSDSWSDRGMGILRGSKALPDGAVATRSSTIS
jgi:hypothetical protein